MIGWIVLGLIAGVLAKIIMPGKDPGGLIVTILIGIAGAFVGGWLAQYIDFLPGSGAGSLIPDIGSVFTATIGAFLLLVIYRKVLG